MEKTNYVIGAALGMNFEEILPWLNSFRMNVYGPYNKQIILIWNDQWKEHNDYLKKLDVIVIRTPKIDKFHDKPKFPHVFRFFYILFYLEQLESNTVGTVFLSDTKDVIFQDNIFSNVSSPFDKDNAKLLKNTIYYTDENILYKNEPWNNENLKQLGPVIYDIMKNYYPKNVGFWGSNSINFLISFLKKFCSLLDSCEVYLCDQSIFSFYLTFIDNNDGNTTCLDVPDAVNLGTQKICIESGVGDLSNKWLTDFKFREQIDIPNHVELDYEKIAVCVVENNYFVPGEIVSVIHQWDRISDTKFKELLREKYKNVNI